LAKAHPVQLGRRGFGLKRIGTATLPFEGRFPPERRRSGRMAATGERRVGSWPGIAENIQRVVELMDRRWAQTTSEPKAKRGGAPATAKGMRTMWMQFPYLPS